MLLSDWLLSLVCYIKDKQTSSVDSLRQAVVNHERHSGKIRLEADHQGQHHQAQAGGAVALR